MSTDLTSYLPDGSNYTSWEVIPTYHRELHVSVNHPMASDDNDGHLQRPMKTINAAASIATPGTRILIHEGTYRECVRPARGGTNPEQMISYENFNNDIVIIKASEITSSFVKSEGWRLNANPWAPQPTNDSQIWETKIDPDVFRGYNPFCAVNILHDRLFIEFDKTDMTTYLNRRGMVFCDGKPLVQVALYQQMSQIPGSYWIEANGQTIHFRLEKDDDPKNHLIELTCREQCFAPEVPFLSYIKVKGLICAHAATGAPVPQRGAISAYRGHHWIIEDCTIDWSNGVGIDIGNECWHHTFDSEQILGYDIIRRCQILDVGVCGIAAMFVRNILIEDNLIKGTGWQKMELSWEAGGLKAHNCQNSLIRRNIFTKTIRADHLWLDVENVNNRITSNLFLDGIEQREAIFIECTREGINLIDNNVFWNVEGRFDTSAIKTEPGSSGWYKMEENSSVNGYAIYGEGTDHLRIAHNFIGKCRSAGYFSKVVAFRIDMGGRGGTSRDAQIYNNIFYDCKEAAIKFPTDKNQTDGNLYLNMPGGYLRVIYPAPEACLDLSSWKEFYGFDMNSLEGKMDVSIDTENYTFTVKNYETTINDFPFGKRDPEFVTKAEEIKKVDAYELISNDFFENEMKDKKRIPGPFIELKDSVVFNIDPRQKLN